MGHRHPHLRPPPILGIGGLLLADRRQGPQPRLEVPDLADQRLHTLFLLHQVSVEQGKLLRIVRHGLEKFDLDNLQRQIVAKEV